MPARNAAASATSHNIELSFNRNRFMVSSDPLTLEVYSAPSVRQSGGSSPLFFASRITCLLVLWNDTMGFGVFLEVAMMRIFRLACAGSIARSRSSYFAPCLRRTPSAINWSKSIGVAANLRSSRSFLSLQAVISLRSAQNEFLHSNRGMINQTS
jgi:hypothetical protein